jgi:broad specificity phosphatase PhoE
VLILVRHGESTANAARLLVGRSDPPLTDEGRRQAAAVRRSLGTVAEIIASPLTRTRDTAAELCPELPVEIDDRWIEVDYGELEGRPLSDVDDAVWHRWRTDVRFAPAGGEPMADVMTRVADACAALFAEPGQGARRDGSDVVVVSHVSPIKAAVAWALGVGVTIAQRSHLDTASVCRIDWRGEGPVLLTFNEVPHRD